RDSSDLRGGLNTPVMCPHSCLCCTSLAQLFCVTSPHCFIPITSLSPSLPASPFESTYLSPLLLSYLVTCPSSPLSPPLISSLSSPVSPPLISSPLIFCLLSPPLSSPHRTS